MYDKIAFFVEYPWLSLIPGAVLLIAFMRTKVKTAAHVAAAWVAYYALASIYDVDWLLHDDVNPSTFDKVFVLSVFFNILLTLYAYIRIKTEVNVAKFVDFSNDWERLDKRRALRLSKAPTDE